MKFSDLKIESINGAPHFKSPKGKRILILRKEQGQNLFGNNRF
tara:strand:- start:40253 stop:40381 length:129 start_codon:yes stop_codon:yes gene_type:complete